MTTSDETIYPTPPIHSQTLPETESTPAIASSVENPENPPWGVPAAIVVWLLSIALLFVVPNLFVAPYVAYHYRGRPAPTEQILLADKTFVLLFVSGWLPAHFLTLAVIWALATRMGKLSLKQVFGWDWTPNFGIWKSTGIALSLFVVAWLTTALFGGKETDLDRILQSSRAAALVLAFLAVATAPLVEEFIYRGLLYSALQRAIGRLFAVIVVAAMFAGLHIWQYRQNIGAILSISVLSLALTVVRARTGRLLPCYIIHVVFNGIQSIIIVLYPYLNALVESSRPKGALTCVLRCLG